MSAEIKLNDVSLATESSGTVTVSSTNIVIPAGLGSSLSLISTQAFSSVTSVSFTNCFSSNYENYKMLMKVDCVDHLWLQFFTTGTTVHTSDHYSGVVKGSDDGGTTTRLASKSDVAAWNMNNQSNTKNYNDVTIYSPHETTETYFTGIQTMKRSAGLFIVNYMGGAVDTTTVFTGFRVFANNFNNYVPSLNLSGKISVYGIKQ